MRKRQSITDQLKEVESGGGGGDFKDMIFVPNGPKLVWGKKDGSLRFGILPAIPQDDEGEYDKSSFLAYRDEDDGFTPWLYIFRQHRRVGGVLDVLSPIFFGEPGTLDPIQKLWDFAWKNEDHWDIICKDPKTKKLTRDAWKEANLRRPEAKVAMNVVVPGEARGSLENGVLICSRTAIFPFDYHELSDKTSERKKGGSWGLADQLDKKAKGGKDAEQSDFEARFYEGDITDPTKMAWCELVMIPAPTGGLASYNCFVLDGEEEGTERFRITKKLLQGRSTPEEIFQQHTPMEVAIAAAEVLVDVTGGPELIADAGGGMGLDYAELVKRFCSTSKSADAKTQSRSKQKEEEQEDDDFVEKAPPKAAKKAKELDDDEADDAPPFREEAEEDLVPLKPGKSTKSKAPEEEAASEPVGRSKAAKEKAKEADKSVPPEVEARRKSIAEALMADGEEDDD